MYRWPWLRIFFHLLDFAVNNAHILYKHNCRKDGVRPKDLLAFRLELVHLLLDRTYCRKRHRPSNHRSEECSPGECRLVRVTDVGLKRGRCNYCLQAHRPQDRHFATFACSSCRVRQTALMSIIETCLTQFRGFLYIIIMLVCTKWWSVSLMVS